MPHVTRRAFSPTGGCPRSRRSPPQAQPAAPVAAHPRASLARRQHAPAGESRSTGYSTPTRAPRCSAVRWRRTRAISCATTAWAAAGRSATAPRCSSTSGATWPRSTATGSTIASCSAPSPPRSQCRPRRMSHVPCSNRPSTQPRHCWAPRPSVTTTPARGSPSQPSLLAAPSHHSGRPSLPSLAPHHPDHPRRYHRPRRLRPRPRRLHPRPRRPPAASPCGASAAVWRAAAPACSA
mmetsp:Transcript_14031/g.36918  ORF Transcript_14031/g.36918 Transcript_14031/m.36918 type:complete len:237 (-) Transcript_14031:339-1049(-)